MLLHHHKYQKINVDQFKCFYCGEPANSIDHCPPISKCEYYKDIKNHYLIPCCLNCNNLLANKTNFTPLERLACLKELLKKKYKTILQMPDWTDEELKEVKGQLKEYIQHEISKKEQLLRRLAWIPNYDEDDFNDDLTYYLEEYDF